MTPTHAHRRCGQSTQSKGRAALVTTRRPKRTQAVPHVAATHGMLCCSRSKGSSSRCGTSAWLRAAPKARRSFVESSRGGNTGAFGSRSSASRSSGTSWRSPRTGIRGAGSAAPKTFPGDARGPTDACRLNRTGGAAARPGAATLALSRGASDAGPARADAAPPNDNAAEGPGAATAFRVGRKCP